MLLGTSRLRSDFNTPRYVLVGDEGRSVKRSNIDFQSYLIEREPKPNLVSEPPLDKLVCWARINSCVWQGMPYASLSIKTGLRSFRVKVDPKFLELSTFLTAGAVGTPRWFCSVLQTRSWRYKPNIGFVEKDTTNAKQSSEFVVEKERYQCVLLPQ